MARTNFNVTVGKDDFTPAQRLRLRRRRIWWRISLAELAQRLEINNATLYYWEMGRGYASSAKGKFWPKLRKYQRVAWLDALERCIEIRKAVMRAQAEGWNHAVLDRDGD